MRGDVELGLEKCNAKCTKETLHTFGEQPTKFYYQARIQGAMRKLFEKDDPNGWWRDVRDHKGSS